MPRKEQGNGAQPGGDRITTLRLNTEEQALVRKLQDHFGKQRTTKADVFRMALRRLAQFEGVQRTNTSKKG